MEVKANKMKQYKGIKCYIIILQLKISENFLIKINISNEKNSF